MIRLPRRLSFVSLVVGVVFGFGLISFVNQSLSSIMLVSRFFLKLRSGAKNRLSRTFSYSDFIKMIITSSNPTLIKKSNQMKQKSQQSMKWISSVMTSGGKSCTTKFEFCAGSWLRRKITKREHWPSKKRGANAVIYSYSWVQPMV